MSKDRDKRKKAEMAARVPAMRVHSFPASMRARKKWGATIQRQTAQAAHANAYAELEARGMDACGLVQLATRTFGSPFGEEECELS